MILVIDVGATKTLIATLNENAEQPEVIEHRHFPTARTPQEFLTDFRTQYETMNKEGLSACVFALPATIKDGEIMGHYANLPDWKTEMGASFNPAKELASDITVPIFVQNDADLAAYGEAATLNFPDTMVYISIGTGIGVGVVSNGLINIYSEAGRMLIDAGGGKMVEWEKIASGTAIQRDFGKIANDITDDKDWRMIAARFAIGLGYIIPVLNPDFIVFGGGVSTNFEKFEAHLPELLNKRLDASVDIPPILKSREPSWAVIYGGFYYIKILALN